MKIENLASIKTRLNFEAVVDGVLTAVPKEHIRGIGKVVIVDAITEKNIPAENRDKLPCLYHPKMPGNPQAWLEVALSPMLPREGNFLKKFFARRNLRTNVVQSLLSMIGMHYHLTLTHGVKQSQIQPAVRRYIEKYFTEWRDRNGGTRVKLLKPILPYLDRFGLWLAKNYQSQLKKKQRQERTAKK